MDTPGGRGYGWSMDDSERLRREIAKRVAKDQDKAAGKTKPRPLGKDLAAMALGMAERAGVSPEKLRLATDAEMEAKERETHRERRVRQAEILARRIPELYREARLPANDAGAIAAKWLRDYRDGERRPLAILGPTGTGKTWVALALARLLLLEDTTPVMFITAADLMAALRPSTVAEHQGLELTQFTSTPVLIVDDLGAEKI
jgi:DNA replication protein DnaC